MVFDKCIAMCTSVSKEEAAAPGFMTEELERIRLRIDKYRLVDRRRTSYLPTPATPVSRPLVRKSWARKPLVSNPLVLSGGRDIRRNDRIAVYRGKKQGEANGARDFAGLVVRVAKVCHRLPDASTNVVLMKAPGGNFFEWRAGTQAVLDAGGREVVEGDFYVLTGTLHQAILHDSTGKIQHDKCMYINSKVKAVKAKSFIITAVHVPFRHGQGCQPETGPAHGC